MDPVTQATLGAVAAQLASRRSQRLAAATLGAVGGMVPDLDILIRSASDPLLMLDFHRQFTHSLVFIPIIGAVTGLVMFGLLGRRWRLNAGQAVLWSTLGCATHGLLDGCTSYGTQLLWPFSDRRFAWDIISIVDPLFTVPLLFAVVLAAAGKPSHWIAAAACWVIVYLGLGVVQHERALSAGRELAATRGHTPSRLEAKPSFGNLVVWKVIYEAGERFYVDAVKVGMHHTVHWPGDSIARLDVRTAFPWLGTEDQQWRDIRRFEHFSAGYTAIDPDFSLRVVDIRYSLLPNRIDPLWGIELSRNRSVDQHVEFFTRRENSRLALKTLIEMIFQKPNAHD